MTLLGPRVPVIALVLVLVALAACGRGDRRPSAGIGGPSTTASVLPSSPAGAPPSRPGPTLPTPLVLTDVDDGRTVMVALGTTLTLRLAPPADWTQVTSSASIVAVVAVDFRSDPGFREWDLRLVGTGTTTIVATGTGRRVTVTLTVQS